MMRNAAGEPALPVKTPTNVCRVWRINVARAPGRTREWSCSASFAHICRAWARSRARALLLRVCLCAEARYCMYLIPALTVAIAQARVHYIVIWCACVGRAYQAPIMIVWTSWSWGKHIRIGMHAHDHVHDSERIRRATPACASCYVRIYVYRCHTHTWHVYVCACICINTYTCAGAYAHKYRTFAYTPIIKILCSINENYG